MVQFDKSGTNVAMAMEFSNLKLNADLPDAQFQYIPAPNIKVVNLTEMMLQMNAPQKPHDSPAGD
jgi:outer membrane lipoprotein-sorting protein